MYEEPRFKLKQRVVYRGKLIGRIQLWLINTGGYQVAFDNGMTITATDNQLEPVPTRLSLSELTREGAVLKSEEGEAFLFPFNEAQLMRAAFIPSIDWHRLEASTWFSVAPEHIENLRRLLRPPEKPPRLAPFSIGDFAIPKVEAWKRVFPDTVTTPEAHRVDQIAPSGEILLVYPFIWWHPDDLERPSPEQLDAHRQKEMRKIINDQLQRPW